MNHVIKVIEYYFKKEEQDLVLSYILHYNLLFRFLKLLDFPFVSNFFLVIFSLSRDISPSKENRARIFEYCRITEFFQDFVSAILHGESHLDPEKIRERYKPKNVAELIDLTAGMKPKEPKEELEEAENLNENQESPTGKPSESKRKPLPPLPEEGVGFSVDIDRIKDILSAKKKLRGKRGLRILNPQKLGNSTGHIMRPTESKAQTSNSTSTSFEKQRITVPLRKNDASGNHALNGSQKCPSMEDYYGTSNEDIKNIIADHFKGRNSQQRAGSPFLHDRVIESSPRSSNHSGKRLNAMFQSNPNSTLHSIKDELNKQSTHLSSLLTVDSRKAESPMFRSTASLLTKSQLAIPYLIDETMDQELLHEINDLYPSGSRILVQSEIDREAKLPTFAPNHILNHDKVPLELTDLLFNMINQALEPDHPALGNMTELTKINANFFWRCLFDTTKGNIFEILLKVTNIAT